MNEYIFIVCEDCAHIESRPAEADGAVRCENCHRYALMVFTDGDKAEDYSQEILDAAKS